MSPPTAVILSWFWNQWTRAAGVVCVCAVARLAEHCSVAQENPGLNHVLLC